MSGIDRHTFRIIDNRASAIQSVEIILSTRLRERYQRRWFGSGAIELIGRLGRLQLLAAFRQLVAIAIEIHEPRLRVCRTRFFGAIDDIRRGEFELEILVAYRPRGHLGDETETEQFPLFAHFNEAGVQVAA